MAWSHILRLTLTLQHSCYVKNTFTTISKLLSNETIVHYNKLWSKSLHDSTQIQFQWNQTCCKSLHLDKGDHLPFWSHLLLDLNGFCHYIQFFITFCIDIIVFSSMIPSLLDFTKIPLDLATPFHLLMYLYAYIFFKCFNLLGLFVYTSTTSFLTGYYLWKTTCLVHVYAYELNGIFHSNDQSGYVHMHCNGTCMFICIFIHLHTCSKYGSSCR